MLVIVVCLATAPDVCREEEPPVDIVSPMQCLVQGQFEASLWLDAHPKWVLRGWRCKHKRQPV